MIRPRLAVGQIVVVGPGKVDLLRAIAMLGSISAAGRSLGMGFRRAWALLDELNQAFGTACVAATAGGHGGGGARLTPLGEAIVAHYDAIEAACERAARPGIAALARYLPR